MEQHIKIVAILNIVLGALGALAALIILLFFGGMAGIVMAEQNAESATATAVLGLIGGIAFFVVALFSVPCLIAGIGLLKFREWARILTIVMSVLNLLHIPLGTAVGIYGLWALLNSETTAFFKTKNAADARQTVPAR
jgi:hypothetical protein